MCLDFHGAFGSDFDGVDYDRFAFVSIWSTYFVI